MVLFTAITCLSILVTVGSASQGYDDLPSMCCTTPDGKNYKINTTFTTADCASKCVCTKEAHLGCIPLCPSTTLKCPIGYKRKETLEPAGKKGSTCYCRKVTCEALGNNVLATSNCFEDGKYYKAGEEFIRGCTKLCRCYPKGKTRCVPLCPQEKPCPSGATTIKVGVPVEFKNNKCKCQANFCKWPPLKDECLINGRSYKTGDDFISPDCSGSCTCQPNGVVFCVSLCPPEGISCQYDEDAIEYSRKVPNSNCSCPTWRCLKRSKLDMTVVKPQHDFDAKTKDTCRSKSGHIYRIGQVFFDQNCTLKCHCQDRGKVACEPLCRDNGDSQDCAPENRKIVDLAIVLPHGDGESNCSCPIEICEPTIDKCIVGDFTYNPGEDFVSPDCSGFCKCYSGGSVVCASLCPPEQVVCENNEEKVQTLKRVPNSNCSCSTWKCLRKKQAVPSKIKKILSVRLPGDSCTSNSGNVYRIGEVFSDRNCSSQCHCQDGGKISCHSLCNNANNMHQCLPHQKERIISVAVKLPDDDGKNCSCTMKVCDGNQDVKDQSYEETCTFETNTYQAGDDFVASDCSGYCKCHPGGSIVCVSLCPPEGITCQHDEDAVELSRKIPNSNCSCPTWKCLKKRQKDQCFVDGHVYNVGENFISSDCAGNCKCLPGQAVACDVLCQQQEVFCLPDEEKKEIIESIPKSNCTCPKWKCVKKKVDHGVCILGGKTYKVGERFVGFNCTGYCTCAGPGAVGCVSLCPLYNVRCKINETRVKIVTPSILDSNCTCPTWKCVKDSGNWTRWSDWTQCDAPCGGGLRHKYRKCTGGTCFGSKTKTEVCNSSPCSPVYSNGPCGSVRMSARSGGPWPRCDNSGFFEPLQCNPSKSQCWCVDKWGNEEPGSRLSSQIPQCKNAVKSNV